MKEYRINDKWILDRVSSQSTSFSQWIENIMKTVEQSIEEFDSVQLDELKKNKEFSSLKNLDKKITRAQKDIAKMGSFGRSMNTLSSKMSKWIMSSVEKELKNSQSELEELDFDIGMITGQQKSLSSALYDVSKDRGIESK